MEGLGPFPDAFLGIPEINVQLPTSLLIIAIKENINDSTMNVNSGQSGRSSESPCFELLYEAQYLGFQLSDRFIASAGKLPCLGGIELLEQP